MSAITLDQLLALNEEIAALVRAGVPLEKNLGLLGGEMPGKLGDLAANISARAARGESLEQIVAEQSAQFPPVYRAVIEAGRRAGRLPAALESLAGTVRRLAETRRAVLVSALYPLFVLILIWSFFAIFTAWIAPTLYDSFKELNVPGQVFFRGLTALGATAKYWGPAGPVVMLLLAAWFWRRSSQASWIDGRGIGGFFEMMPWIGPMIANSRNAAFTEMFATLLSHQVPMHEALVLAADSAGGAKLRTSVRQAAESMRAGRPLGENDGLAAFPPLLRWMIPAASGQSLLLPALNRAAVMYRHRAEYLAETIRVYLPLLLIAVVAGGMTLGYTLCLFAPYTAMLRNLAR
ncbi:MAG: type II secretion system F family protein [Pirellulales bacterium]|nr:type II secretion system F family protein [Pirellulales bacterium]